MLSVIVRVRVKVSVRVSFGVNVSFRVSLRSQLVEHHSFSRNSVRYPNGITKRMEL